MMKELERQLNEYFYCGEYQERVGESEALKAAYEEYYTYMMPILQSDKKLFFKMEGAISRAELECERRGFLQGYQYALTMLGISSGGGGTVNGLFGKEHTRE